MGTLHALSTIWGLLLTGGAADGEGEPSALDLAATTITRLTELAGRENLQVDDRTSVAAALDDVAAWAAAEVRRLEPAGQVALHDHVTEDLRRAGRALAAAGAGAAPARGTVDRVNASDGGVPKRSVGRADVGLRGLNVDRQRSRRHHGKPLQALCLWSSEVIARLQAEGHPIDAGYAGENLTLSGLDWTDIRPGARIRIGTVLAEVSAPALPCDNNASWFLNGDFRRMHHEREPGVTRWYAWVLEPGVVTEGDPVVVEPSQ